MWSSWILLKGKSSSNVQNANSGCKRIKDVITWLVNVNFNFAISVEEIMANVSVF